MEENNSGLVRGIVLGLVAAIIGAGIYAAIIAITEYELGIVAIGVGVLVGLAMMIGRPTSPVLAPLAALLGLVGAAAGTVFGAAALVDKMVGEASPGIFSLVSDLLPELPNLISEDPKTLLFWAISAVAAFSFVNKRVKAARAAEQTPGEQGPGQEQQDVSVFKPHEGQKPSV